MNSSFRRSTTLRTSDISRSFNPGTSYILRPALSIAGSHSILRPSITPARWYRNINLLSIDYAFRPRLRARLTPGGRTFPGNPWVFGDQNSHLVFRYSCLHGHLYTVHLRSLIGFYPYTTLFYRRDLITTRGFGFGFQSRSSSARYHSISELLRTL